MAKHISKSVIEDIAYEIKRVGLITKAYEDETVSEEMSLNFGSIDDFNLSATRTLEWLTANIADILAEHDPTFDYDRFNKQASFNIEI